MVADSISTSANSIIVGNTTISEVEINKLDNIVEGTVLASKAVVVDANNDISGFNDVSVDGKLTTAQLKLGDTDVVSTAADINNLSGVTKGTVSGGKAVIVDAQSDISGFRDVTATGKVTTGSIVLDGTAITSSATEINKLNTVVDGTVSAGKAVIVDENKDITGLRNVTSTGDSNTANLNVSNDANINKLTVTGASDINSVTSKTLGGSVFKLQTSSTDIQVNDVLGKIEFQAPDETTGAVANMTSASIVAQSEGDFSSTSNATKLSFMTGGTAPTSERMSIDSSGNVTVTSGDVTVNGSQQISENLTVDGNLVLGTTTLDETSLAVVENLTLGQSADGKAVTQSITGVTKLGESGGNQVVDIVSHDSTASGLKLGGVLVKSTATEINTLNAVTSGTASAHKAVVLDANKNITGINNVTITGELSAQTLDINGVDITAISEEINKLSSVSAGTISAGKAVVVNDDKNISGFSDVSLTGKLTTGSINLGGTDVTSTADDINMLQGLTKGTVTASKAVIVDAQSNISGFNDVSATGRVTASNLTLGGTAVDSTAEELNTLNTVTGGTVSADKAVVVDGSNNISGFGNVGISGTATVGSMSVSELRTLIVFLQNHQVGQY